MIYKHYYQVGEIISDEEKGNIFWVVQTYIKKKQQGDLVYKHVLFNFIFETFTYFHFLPQE